MCTNNNPPKANQERPLSFQFLSLVGTSKYFKSYRVYANWQMSSRKILARGSFLLLSVYSLLHIANKLHKYATTITTRKRNGTTNRKTNVHINFHCLNKKKLPGEKFAVVPCISMHVWMYVALHISIVVFIWVSKFRTVYK